MLEENLKFVVGSVTAGQPAKMKIFGDIDEYTAMSFANEFEWVENRKPSLIKVLINSPGGSVLHGMSIYTLIANSDVPTVCVNEGLAASMASVILAAGQKSYMRDYAILMLHNPFDSANSDSDSAMDFVKAYTEQLSTIYHKRFGLSREQVKEIMDGKPGKDGTIFTAQEAVNAGIFPSTHIIASSQQIRDDISTKLIEAKSDLSKISAIMASIDLDKVDEQETPTSTHSQPIIENNSNLNKSTTKTKSMENNNVPFELSAIAASLGLQSKFEIDDLMNKVNELKDVRARFDTVKKELDEAKIVAAGHETTISNLTQQLQETKAQLNVYETAEAQKKENEITEMIAAAVKDGKIKNDETVIASWKEMAKSNIELVKNTLSSIPATAPISTQISNDPKNVENAAKATGELGNQVEAKIKAVVGEDFKFAKASEL